MKTLFVLITLATTLLFGGNVSADISNLRVVGITDSTATLELNIDPVVDIAIEIDSVNGNSPLSNTGLYPKHHYKIHNQITLLPGTEYTIKLTPLGAPSETISFRTVGNVSTISNLRVEDITESTATVKLNIDPIVDIAMEIDSGNGYVPLSNTGLYQSHRYLIHNQVTLSPETDYTIRLTPVGGSSQTIAFTTDGPDGPGGPGGPGIDGEIVSYESIEANGLGNGTYPTDDHYLAEFLYQNPDVCFWEQDPKNKTIKPLETPVPPENSVYMPSPTGGDDTAMLESFFSKNAGNSVVGQGTYKVSTLDIKKKIDIYNMPMEPTSSARQMVRISAPDVRIFNSPIDGKNSSRLAIGFNVEDGAHRFALVNSGFKDIHHKSKANATAVFIREANDFYIVCNRFENIINNTSDKTKTARANSIWLNGRKTNTLSGGLIANNYSNNHQSNGRLVDAEFFTIQGYKSVSKDKPVRIFANRAYNAGKRFTKNQEGNTLILSNYIEWNTKSGPLGRRTLLAVFVIHQNDNVIIRNNRIKISAEGNFGKVFHTDASTGTHTAHLGGKVQNNIHFDNNDIELKDNRDPNARSGPVLISATASHVDLQAIGYEARNSSANNNNVYGTGSLKNYFFFRNGYADDGGRFEHKNNVFSVPFYQSEYLKF